jgi:hypothetical protein
LIMLYYINFLSYLKKVVLYLFIVDLCLFYKKLKGCC